MTPRFLFTLAFGAALPVFAAYAAYFKAHGISDLDTLTQNKQLTEDDAVVEAAGFIRLESGSQAEPTVLRGRNFSGAMPGTVAPSVCALKAGAQCAYPISTSPRDAAATTERTLWALASIESGNDSKAIGRRGERGAYQFRKSAWVQACSALGCRHKFTSAHDAIIARTHAASHLRWIISHLTTVRGSAPSAQDLFAVWNCGLHAYQRRGFSLNRMPASTQDAAQRFANLINL